MSYTLLKDVATATVDANGNATVVNRPEVGEYWAPLLVSVSTTSALSPVAHATVYHGSPGVPVNQNQYIDDTFLGSGDTSSVISGTSIQYGEAVITTFVGGRVGDTATVVVYGQTSDFPSNISLAPQVPGTRFAGHPSTEIVLNDGFVSPATPLMVPPLSTVTINAAGSISNGGFTDVRQFNSYSLRISPIVTVAATPAASPNPSTVTLKWASQPSTNIRLYQDLAQWWTNSAGGTYVLQNGETFMQDVHHGPYLTVLYSNESAVDTVALSYTLQYSTRQQPSQHVSQLINTDGTLALANGAVPGGTSIDLLCPIAYGRASWKLGNTGANPLTYTILYGTLPTVDQFTVAAGTADRREIIVPKRAIRYNIAALAGASAYNVNTFSQFDKMG